MILAVTGGTGFVGSHLIDEAVAAGHQVRALTRRAMAERTGVEWIQGALEDSEPMERLTDGADALIHVAGVITAPDAAAFEKGNVGGTLSALAAATASGTRRFVHVSSLAAREPALSRYGASKARAEDLVEGSGLDWAIVRPPAVYGPRDRETLELFKMAKLGLMVMPPKGRFSIIHVRDLVRLLLRLAEPAAPSHLTVEPDDGRSGGWTHDEFARSLGDAVGRKPIVMSAPAAVMKLAARADQLVRRAKAKLTVDRAAYFSHRDWVVSRDCGVPISLWHPLVETTDGLRSTAAWYKREGWL